MKKSQSLLGFHAFTGCDTTGRFSGKSKATWFKLFLNTDENTTDAFQALSNVTSLSEATEKTLSSFVCRAYCPSGVVIGELHQLRWHLFCKHLAESDRLPPTESALHEHCLRAHFQASVWGQANIPMQIQMDPLVNGWCNNGGVIMAVTTKLEPAPAAILELVKCACKKNNCTSSRCNCKSRGLICTDLCLCSECENEDHVLYTIGEDEDDTDN